MPSLLSDSNDLIHQGAPRDFNFRLELFRHLNPTVTVWNLKRREGFFLSGRYREGIIMANENTVLIKAFMLSLAGK